MHDTAFYISSIKLKNFRKFKSFEMSLNPDFTVMIGNNGAGKTSVLEAISIAAGTFFTKIEDATSPAINHSDACNAVFTQGSVSVAQGQYPIEIEAEGIFSGERYSWKRSVSSKKGRTTRVGSAEFIAYGEHLQQCVSKGEPVLLPIVAYYDANRFASKGNSSSKLISTNDSSYLPSRTKGYVKALDAIIDEGQTLTWLRNMTIWELQHSATSPELSCVKEAIKQSLSGVEEISVERVWFDMQMQDILVQYHERQDALVQYCDSSKGEKIDSASSLSDGYRAALLMFADIARRMAQLNPQLLDRALETPGVVLIDEVDLHLHPLWQSRIVQDLRRTFPNVQFIITTHSPTVLSTIQRENVRVLRENGAEAPSADVYGRDVASIMKTIMKAPARPDGIADMLVECSRLIDSGSYEAAESKIAEIENLIGEDDPELTKLRIGLALERL